MKPNILPNKCPKYPDDPDLSQFSDQDFGQDLDSSDILNSSKGLGLPEKPNHKTHSKYPQYPEDPDCPNNSDDLSKSDHPQYPALYPDTSSDSRHQGLVQPCAVFEFVVSAGQARTRIDRFLAEQFPLYTRSFFQQLIEKAKVSINGITSKKSGVILKEGQLVIVTFPAARSTDKTQFDSKSAGIQVVYESDLFLIINKPAGLLVHSPHHLSNEVTLIDWLLHHYQEIQDVGYVDRPGIVHRLDKDTSGLLIVPRTQHAHAIFGNMFRERYMHKTYHAIVEGHPLRTGTINLAIGRDPAYKTRMRAFKNDTEYPGVHRRDATSHYTVLSYFKDHSLVEVKPISGRTHQIRVHFSAIGHPLLGDTIYGKESKLLKRHALHAHKLSFAFHNTEHDFTQELPEDLQGLIALLQKQ